MATCSSSTRRNRHYRSSNAFSGSRGWQLEDDSTVIRQDKQVQSWNVDNGERLVTYATRAERRGTITSLNGSTLCGASVGDRIIIASCARSGNMNVPDETRAMIVDQLATSL